MVLQCGSETRAHQANGYQETDAPTGIVVHVVPAIMVLNIVAELVICLSRDESQFVERFDQLETISKSEYTKKADRLNVTDIGKVRSWNLLVLNTDKFNLGVHEGRGEGMI